VIRILKIVNKEYL